MAKKSDIKKCRYAHCLHDCKDIDLTTDKFIKNGSSYFHEDCYQARQNIQLIKQLWHDHIDELVVYSQLNKILNQLIFNDHVSSDYLVFAVKYSINSDDINLRHPPGLKYVIGNQRVKNAYNKSIVKNAPQSAFVAKEDESTSPKFSFKAKKSGFGSILGG